MVRAERRRLAVGLQGATQIAPPPPDHPEVEPAQANLRCHGGCLAAELFGILQLVLVQQQGRQVQPRRQGEPRRQGCHQRLAVERDGGRRFALRLRHGQVQQEFIALGMGSSWAVLQTAAQQRDAALRLPLGHLEAAELGAGVGVVGAGQQLRFHRCAQACGLVAGAQQLRPVAVVQQGWCAAVGDAPVGFPLEQRGHAVVHERVVRAAPADGGVAAEQATHVGVGRLQRSQLLAQQVDQQQLRLLHQLPHWFAGLGPQLLIGIEHQHPVAADPLQGLVAGRCEISRPVDPMHGRPQPLGDRHRVVAGAGVHHHHLVDETLHRAQAGREPLRLVAHDHRQAEHGGGRGAGGDGLRLGAAARRAASGLGLGSGWVGFSR